MFCELKGPDRTSMLLRGSRSTRKERKREEENTQHALFSSLLFSSGISTTFLGQRRSAPRPTAGRKTGMSEGALSIPVVDIQGGWEDRMSVMNGAPSTCFRALLGQQRMAHRSLEGSRTRTLSGFLSSPLTSHISQPTPRIPHLAVAPPGSRAQRRPERI